MLPKAKQLIKSIGTSMPLKSPSTIRFQLSCLVVASVLPVWLVSGVLVFQAYTAKRNQVNQGIPPRGGQASTDGFWMGTHHHAREGGTGRWHVPVGQC